MIGYAARRTRAELVPLLGLLLLLAVCAALATAAPREFRRSGEEALNAALAADPASAAVSFTATTTTYHSGPGQVPEPYASTSGPAIAAATAELADRLGLPTIADTRRGELSGPRYQLPGRLLTGAWPRVRLVYRTDRPDPPATGLGPPPPGTVDVALSRATATELQLTLGQVVPLTVDSDVAFVIPLRIRLAAVVDAAADQLPWSEVVGSARPLPVVEGDIALLVGSVFVLPGSLPTWLATVPSPVRYTWRYDLSAPGGSLAGALATAERLAAVRSSPPRLPLGPDSPDRGTALANGWSAPQPILEARATLIDTVADFDRQRRTASTLLLLALAPVGAVAALAIWSAGWQLALARRPRAALFAARGGSGTQALAADLAEAVVLVALGAGIGWCVGTVAVPVPGAGPGAGPGGWPSAAVALAGLPALVVPARVVPSAVGGPGGAAGWSGRRRFGAAARRLGELLVLILAARGVWTLRTTEPGEDPLLGVAPVLVLLAVGLLVVRAYPPLLSAVARLAARGRGLPAFVGLARAGARPAPFAAALLALVVAVGGAAFAATITSTVGAARAAAAWRQVGGDLKADLDVPLGADRAAIAAGLWDATEASTGEASTGGASTGGASTGGASTAVALSATDLPVPSGIGTAGSVRVIVVDLRALAELWRGTPLGSWVGPLESAAGREPRARAVLAAPTDSDRERGAAYARSANLDLQEIVTAGMPGQDSAALVLLLDPTAPIPRLGRGQESVLVRGDTGAVRAFTAAAAAVNARLADRESAERAVNAAPISGRLTTELTTGAAVALAFCALIMVSALLLSGRDRHEALAVLRALGMAGRTGAAVVAIELAAVILIALVCGLAAGAGLLSMLGPGVNLGVLIGDGARPAPSYDPAVFALLAGVVAAIGVVAAGVAVRREKR